MQLLGKWGLFTAEVLLAYSGLQVGLLLAAFVQLTRQKARCFEIQNDKQERENNNLARLEAQARAQVQSAQQESINAYPHLHVPSIKN